MVKIYALIVLASVFMTGCGSAPSAGNASAANAAPNDVAQSNTSPSLTAANVNSYGKDIFASFKKDEDYETLVRPKLVDDGWQPARTADGDENCASGSEICKKFPELEAGPSSPRGDAILRWKKGEKIVNIYTYDRQLFNRYEFEKPAAQTSAANISGKYTHRYTQDYGGEISFTFTNKDRVAFEWIQEDVTWKGAGTWKWDAAKKRVTATVTVEPDVETEEAAGKEMQNRIETYVFESSGTDLKLVGSPNGMSPYKGKVFRKG